MSHPSKLWFAILGGVLLAGCHQKHDDYLPGYVEADYIRIAAPISGRLVKLNVQNGQTVTKNMPAFALEQESEFAARSEAEAAVQRATASVDNLKKGRRPDEVNALRAQVAEAEATQGLASADLERKRQLVTSKFISPAALDEARSALARSQAQVNAARAQLRQAQQGARSDEIAAAVQDQKAAEAQLAQVQWKLSQKMQAIPLDARVAELYYHEGEFVPAGSPVLSLLAPEHIKARFFVPETALGALHLGQMVSISCDACGAPIRATISYLAANAEYTSPLIYSRENRANLVFMVEARPPLQDANRLHPGLPLEVRLIAAQSDATTSAPSPAKQP